MNLAYTYSFTKNGPNVKYFPLLYFIFQRVGKCLCYNNTLMGFSAFILSGNIIDKRGLVLLRLFPLPHKKKML